MISALLCVVGQQLLEVPVKDPDAGDDLAGSRCPREGFRVAVPVLDVRVDRLDEEAEGGERAAPDRLPGDDVEPDFYLVQPGTAGRGEMKGDTGMIGEPGVHVSSLVCRQVIQHDMDLAVAIPCDHGVHEPEELLGAPPLIALAEHLTGSGVQRGEQVRRAVAYVVMGAL